MYYVLVSSPALVFAVLVVLAVAMGRLWLLVGIPLALLGFVLATPAFMKSVGSTLSFAALLGLLASVV